MDQRIAQVTAAQAPASAAAGAQSSRMLYIDNIRWTIIVLVVSMHAADVYSPAGPWYWKDWADIKRMNLPSRIGVVSYQAYLSTFFMSLLFLIAGYFAAHSLDRKGPRRFVQDRLVRLGLPTLLFMLAIGPFIEYYLSRNWPADGFAHQWLVHLLDGRWLWETGPLWFCALLLIFSMIYAAASAMGLDRRLDSVAVPNVLSSPAAIAGFIVLLALVTFASRVVVPHATLILNIMPYHLPHYVLAFPVGVLAARRGWLERLSEASALRHGRLLIASSLLLWLLLLYLSGAFSWQFPNFGGTRFTLGLAAWDAIAFVGFSLAILAVYRRHFDRQGAFARFMSDNAFAVFVFHAPIVVALSRAQQGWDAPPVLKALTLTTLSTVAAFAVAPALRRIPLLKRIL